MRRCLLALQRFEAVRDHVWDSSSPRECVGCYFYLLSLKRRLAKEVQADFDAFKCDLGRVGSAAFWGWRWVPSQVRDVGEGGGHGARREVPGVWVFGEEGSTDADEAEEE